QTESSIALAMGSDTGNLFVQGLLMVLYKLIGLPLTGFFLALVGSSAIVMVLNWKIMVMVLE
ncbi:hypothetical protein, partial [Klebsiella variicola]|uniref:hypothetical protein n=1 Tax=Klebsiella variicola TaxID=244366 RepID=UPI001953CCE1